jgi:hypothetical protein
MEIIGSDRILMLKELFDNLMARGVDCFISTNNNHDTVVNYLTFILGFYPNGHIKGIHSAQGYTDLNNKAKHIRLCSKETFVLKHLIEEMGYKQVVFIDDESRFVEYQEPINTYDAHFSFNHKGSTCHIITTLKHNGTGMTMKEVNLIQNLVLGHQ